MNDGSFDGALPPPTDSDAKGEAVERHSRRFPRRHGDRVRDAKRQIAETGYMPGGQGHGIYGYRYDPELKKRVVNPQEAPVVQRVFEEYDMGLTAYRIAQGLTADGIPTKRGGTWGTAVILSLLRNWSYVGIDFYGKTRTVRSPGLGPVKVTAPRITWIEIRGFTPPLIELELFKRVQRRLNLQLAGRRLAKRRR